MRKIADYVGQKYGGAMRYAVENLKEKVVILPNDLEDTATKTEIMIYNEEVKEAVKERKRMKQDLEKLYSIIWGQSSLAMRAKVRTIQGYDIMRDQQNSIMLMQEIKKICYNFQEKNYVPASIHTVLDRFINCKQKEDMSDQKYLDQFNDAVRTLKSYNIMINVADLIVKQEHGDISNRNNQEH